MSFKREGDDLSQLGALKKRRVGDLLSSFIPEDEATLMKNGRYSCLICSHRPVFDTVDMLTVHRKGKRHLEGLKWFYGKKAQLQNEIAKRQHQVYVNKEDDRQEAGSSAPLLTQTRNITHHALLRSVPYSSCHKKASERSENTTEHFHSNLKTPSVSVTQNLKAAANEELNTDSKAAYVKTIHCPDRKHLEKKKKGFKAVSAQESDSEPLSEQRRKEMEHYLRLKSAGWLQDSSGKWMKDDNVEFDSDEEEPPSLLPSSETT